MCSLAFSQNTEFSITDEGLSKYVIAETKGHSKEELYNKTIEWINRSYKNPKEVIKSTIPNDYIRIEGYSDNVFKRQAIGGTIPTGLRYQIEISFKDDKYKFEVIGIEMKNTLFPSYSSSPFTVLNLAKGNEYVRKKSGEFRNSYKNVGDIPLFFDRLNAQLKTYIESGVSDNKSNNDW